MRIADSKYGVLLTIPGLIIILALVVFPLGMLLITSFMQFTPMLPIKFNGIKNYEYIFGDRLFWLSLPKTIIYAGGATGLTFCGGLIIALLLSKITRASGIFRSLTMFTWAVPLVISGFIWRWIFNPNVGIFSDLLMKLHLISEPIPIFSNPTLAMAACIVADSWVRIPFMTIFALAGIESIPRELYDAARVDGADCISMFRYITLPLIRHMVFIGLLITSMISFRTLDVIFSMTGGGPSRSTYVLALYIIDQLWMRVNYGTGSAAGVVMLFLISSFSSFYIYLILKKR
jgi:multiple sugar transport system permease protein